MTTNSGEVSAELLGAPPLAPALPAFSRGARRRLASAPRRNTRSPVWREARALYELGSPLALAALVSMGISITDVVQMGWLGPAALAGGAAASDLYSIFFYLGAGVLQAVAPLVAHARGAGDRLEASRFARQGLWAALAVALPGAVAVWHADVVLGAVGVVPEVAAMARPYARAMALTFVPMTGVMLLRQLLAACGRPRAFFWAMVAALPLNALGNWLLAEGKLGLPRLGLAGIGLSSFAVAVFLLLVLASAFVRDPELRALRLLASVPRPDGPRLRGLFRVGAPIGAGNLGEMGVFLFSTVIVGTIGVEVLAAHAVALRMAGVLYALPLGLAQAATVRVALGAGARDGAAVARTARVALGLSAAIGASSLLGILALRPRIAAAFLDSDAAAPAFALATTFLVVLAIVQPLDGLAVAATGALRGLADTRAPMLWLLGGHWALGFTTALVLAFVCDLGGLGIWIGLAVGSAAVAAGMTARLRSQIRRINVG